MLLLIIEFIPPLANTECLGDVEGGNGEEEGRGREGVKEGKLGEEGGLMRKGMGGGEGRSSRDI